MDLREVLRTELARRCDRNPRYSLRAYARWLGIHHGSLSRILNGRRALMPRTIQSLAPRIGLSPQQVHIACVESHCERILALVDDPRFQPNSRWIATVTGIRIDDVNVALHWLLHTKRIAMISPSTWIVTEA